MMVSVVLPTYNERDNIDRLVERIERALAGTTHELIFVDDSTDGTEAAIAGYAKRISHVLLIHREARRGLATAIVEGVCRARGDAICVLDADLQHPPEVLPVLIEALQRTGADIVVASRNIAGGEYEAFTRVRRAASWAATWLARMLLSRARFTSDPMSGFFIVRREAIKDVPLQPLGYKILLEILVRGRVTRVCEVPYRFRTRGAGRSKLSVQQQVEFLAHILRLVTIQPDDLRFIRFCLVGASGVLVNMGLLWALAAHGMYYVYAGIAAIVTATTWNFLLNNALTWGDRRARSVPITTVRYLRYCAVSGAGSGLQLVLLFALTTAGLPYLISNLAGVGAATVWNFRVNGRWTWKAPRSTVSRIIYRGRSLDQLDPFIPARSAGR